MGDKGKEPAQEMVEKNSTSADDLVVDCEIPKINLEDLEGHDNPMVAMLNTLTGRCPYPLHVGIYVKQLKMLTEHVVGHRKLVNLIWSQHCELENAFKEENELTRKGILYSIEGAEVMPYWIASQLSVMNSLERSVLRVRKKGFQLLPPQMSQMLRCNKLLLNSRRNCTEAAPPNTEEVAQKSCLDTLDPSTFHKCRLKVCFKPPSGMQFLITEIACGAYVFSKSKYKTEVLYEDDRQTLDRKTLWLLRPKKIVSTEELALNPAGYCKETLEFMIRRYMGYVDETMKIYVPLSCSGHWFLLVVDLIDSKRVYR
ncbi:hypothetical protein PIB30_011852 [Stylosanthes scabra]|uniref:Ubiquitin-like protease family profile domain-containing protein n=1 Tax=Stylosanthes scabra TaxID=79078 RepID=A0ABU6T7B1_9FABA|nr:hypothetical protein [Stylosanthes scabra]